MIFKVELKNKYKKQIEYLRGVGGDYNPDVFFWDIMIKEEFDNREALVEFLKEKLSVFDMEKIEIKEVGFK